MRKACRMASRCCSTSPNPAEREGQTELQHFRCLAVTDIAHGLVHCRARRERNLHVVLLEHVQLLGVDPARMEQSILGRSSPLLKPRNITHTVFQMRSDCFVAVLAGVADDADATFRGERAHTPQQIVGHRDGNADREPSLEWPSSAPSYSATISSARASASSVGSKKFFGEYAHGSLTHVKHRACNHATHAAFLDGLRCLGSEVAPGSAKQVVPARIISSCARRAAHSASPLSMWASTGQSRRKPPGPE